MMPLTAKDTKYGFGRLIDLARMAVAVKARQGPADQAGHDAGIADGEDTVGMKISTILDHIDSGHMALPEFQRGYVWNRDQVRGLLDSLYRRHPVGGLPETGGRGERLEEQPTQPCRQTRNIRQRPPATPTLLAHPSSVFDTGDSGISCRHSFI